MPHANITGTFDTTRSGMDSLFRGNMTGSINVPASTDYNFNRLVGTIGTPTTAVWDQKPSLMKMRKRGDKVNLLAVDELFPHNSGQVSTEPDEAGSNKVKVIRKHEVSTSPLAITN